MMEQCPLGVYLLAQRQGQGYRGPSSCVENMGASKPRLGSVQNLDHYPQGPPGREYGPSFTAQKKQLISLLLTIVRKSSPARLSDKFIFLPTLFLKFPLSPSSKPFRSEQAGGPHDP